MEDWLFNRRAALFTEFAWRAGSVDGHQAVVGATTPTQVPFEWLHDAHYNVNPSGASYSDPQVVREDYRVTAVCFGEDNALGHVPAELPPPVPEVFPL